MALDLFMAEQFSTLTIYCKPANQVSWLNLVMLTLQERLTEIMEAKGWDYPKLVTVSGESRSVVSQWLGKSSKIIKSIGKMQAAERIEQESGYAALWIAKGLGPKIAAPSANAWRPSMKRTQMLSPQDEQDAEFIDEGPLTRNPNFVPVVGMAKLGDNGYYEEVSSAPGVGDGAVEAYSEDPGAYALRVRGDSMFPAIRDGWYVVVEPHGRPTPGEYVLIKLLNGQMMVKELIMERDESITVVSVNGDTRRTILREEIDSHYGLQPVSAILSPSKWKP